MLDIELIRNKLDVVKDSLQKRRMDASLADKVHELDVRWREALKRLEQKRHEHNQVTKQIAIAKKEGKSVEALLVKSKELKEEIEELEIQVDALRKRRDEILMLLPNILHPSVPVGFSDEENVEIKRVGETKPGKHHYDIVKEFGLVDSDKAAEIAGARFYYELNKLAILDLALALYAFKKFWQAGFKPVVPPYMIRRKAEEGATSLEQFEEQIYKIENEDLYLIPTAEHPVAAYKMNEVLHELPLRVVAFSACFRKEAGAHGKDTKGIFRVHQFHKVELYSFCHPDESYDEMEKLLALSEEILRELNIPYRIVKVCSGEMDKKVALQYDIEGWFPGQQKYRELGSVGNVLDWQSRRLNIKYWDKKENRPKFCHTVFATGVAIQRTMCAMLENNLDGDVIRIPRVLQPYTGFSEIEKVKK